MRSTVTFATIVCAVTGCVVWGVWAANDVGTSIPSVPQHCVYHAGGELPDPRCTPGAVSTAYTKARICRYDDPPRPPITYTEPLKRRLIRSYDSAFGSSLRGYELDHLIPLELGGDPTSVKNLWPEPHPSSYAKDYIENKLHRSVCSGQMTLRHAQSLIRHDWRQG